MLNHDEIIKRAIDECYRELYSKALPKVDYDQLLADAKAGKIDESETPIYNRYYVSHEEFKYITEKYLEAYGLSEKWSSNMDIAIEYLEKGGTKDKYIEEHDDEYGHHPGYRGYEKVPAIKEQIKKIIANSENQAFYSGEQIDKLSNTITESVLNTLKECKKFYRFDRDAHTFMMSVALGGPSPTSNKQTVIDYWKKQGINIKIVDKNPLLLWEYDNYGDEMDSIMTEEYGENWKDIWDKKWQDKLAADEKHREELLKKIKEQQNEEQQKLDKK